MTAEERKADEGDERRETGEPERKGIARDDVQLVPERDFLYEERDSEQERRADKPAVRGIPQRRVGISDALERTDRCSSAMCSGRTPKIRKIPLTCSGSFGEGSSLRAEQ